METLAAAALIREHLPDLRVRVVNIVDLMALQPPSEHPSGMTDAEFDALFTTDRPVIFAYHGYPWLIHRLTYRRTNHENLHVRGYKEEGTTTTPFDMVMLNDLDRYHLVMDVIDRVPRLGQRAAGVRQLMVDARLRARLYTREKGRTCPKSSTGPGPSDRSGDARPLRELRQLDAQVRPRRVDRAYRRIRRRRRQGPRGPRGDRCNDQSLDVARPERRGRAGR
jgi:xylulose-5-phosphate/fructose-6-phosphate phosphoketolase